MPVTEMVTSISVGLFFLVAFVFLLRLIQASMLHKTLRNAIERDSPLAPGLVDRIGRGDPAAQRTGSDDRIGLILVGIGLATLGYAVIAGDSDWRQVMGGALFPLLVGAALLIRHHWARRSSDRDLATDA